jgi:hypothetical protein
MSSRKHSREPDVLVKVASGALFHAQSCILRSFCANAEGLPAAEEWDVSGLLLDGQPFSRETVSCWMNCAYSLIDGSEQLGQHDIEQLSSAGLAQVLAFANAVGSSEGLFRAACSQLQHLKFVVQLPEQVLQLPLATFIYCFRGIYEPELVRYNLQGKASVGRPLATLAQRSDVRQQVAQQLSALLQVAHVLHLQPLLDVLHQFIYSNVNSAVGRDTDSILSGVEGLVFSDAVLEAALGSSALSKETYVNSVLSAPCNLAPGADGYGGLFKPVGTPKDSVRFDTLEFDAELLCGFAGGQAGDTVKVTLALFSNWWTGGSAKGWIRLEVPTASGVRSTLTLPAQLLVGSTCANAAELEAFLRVEAEPLRYSQAEWLGPCTPGCMCCC